MAAGCSILAIMYFLCGRYVESPVDQISYFLLCDFEALPASAICCGPHRSQDLRGDG